MENEQTGATRVGRAQEIIAVLLLSVTAVLTAWCGFQAAKWGGEMSIAFSEASSARIQAGNSEGQARDARQFDLTIYAQWAVAELSGDEELAAYAEQRFTPALATAFDAWRADGMSETGPFVRAEYVPEGTVEARELTERAERRFAAALTYNQRGDNYSLMTVLFALVLFLTAVAQRNIPSRLAGALLALATVASLTGMIITFTFPIKI
ncbi:hypothetical protein [Leucobacter triazinivorans]|uniref:Uncharacterized protein n=1 Tax=Leucobacter triazinivorans TaxID=1784719 RepID=A0A4P6KF41_9MICO|nr:hypothetical protein [Leucobacter triazinivorans]QBE48922.1 hypothetical protein EVS81_08805 [Leucobacter triazinivorans]